VLAHRAQFAPRGARNRRRSGSRSDAPSHYDAVGGVGSESARRSETTTSGQIGANRVEGRRVVALLRYVSAQRPQNRAGNSSLHPARQRRHGNRGCRVVHGSSRVTMRSSTSVRLGPQLRHLWPFALRAAFLRSLVGRDPTTTAATLPHAAPVTAQVNRPPMQGGAAWFPGSCISTSTRKGGLPSAFLPMQA
jgi:hypothetical protein